MCVRFILASPAHTHLPRHVVVHDRRVCKGDTMHIPMLSTRALHIPSYGLQYLWHLLCCSIPKQSPCLL